MSVQSVAENLYDVAGIRVICSFIDDIYVVAEMLARQDDVNVLMVKDYIRCPKVNGYRSYHMIIEIPVFFPTGRRRCGWRSRSVPWPWTSGPAWTTR